MNATIRALTVVVGFVLSLSVAARGHAFEWRVIAERPLFSFPQTSGFTIESEPRDEEPDRLKLAMERILSRNRLAATAVTAGLAHVSDSSLTRGYGDGLEGYAKRFASQNAFLASRDLIGTYAIATLLDEDPRYQRSSERGLWNRIGHALSSTVLTRPHGGGTSWNVSNLGGTAAAAGLSNLWHASEDRGGKETLARFGLGLAAEALYRLFLEFR